MITVLAVVAAVVVAGVVAWRRQDAPIVGVVAGVACGWAARLVVEWILSR